MINTSLSSMFDVDSKFPQFGTIVSYFEHQKPPTQAQVSRHTVERSIQGLIDLRQKQVLDMLISMHEQDVKTLDKLLP